MTNNTWLSPVLMKASCTVFLQRGSTEHRMMFLVVPLGVCWWLNAEDGTIWMHPIPQVSARRASSEFWGDSNTITSQKGFPFSFAFSSIAACVCRLLAFNLVCIKGWSTSSCIKGWINAVSPHCCLGEVPHRLLKPRGKTAPLRSLGDLLQAFY